MKTLCLIDGSSYLFRAYYAIQPLTNSKGVPTHVVLGFTNMVLKVLGQLKPDYVAMVWDNPDGSFRNDLYEDYKADRDTCPEDLSIQIPLVFDVVKALGFHQVNRKGFEADDVIATWAHRGKKSHDVVIVSSDKDLTQLVGPNVTMWDTMRDRKFTPKTVEEKWGVPPERMRDYLSLIGDSSDNIPGVRGIGPKGALKLLGEYDSLKNIYKALPKMKESRTKKLLEEGKEDAEMSYELIGLVTDIDLKEKINDLKPQPCDQKELMKILTELELRGVLQRLVNMKLIASAGEQQTFALEQTEKAKQSYRALLDEGDIETMVGMIEQAAKVCMVPIRAKAGSPETIGFALSIKKNHGWYVPLDPPEGSPGLAWKDLKGHFKKFVSDPEILKYGHDLKSLSKEFHRLGLTLEGINGDSLIAAYLVDATSKNSPPRLAAQYLDREITDLEEKGREAVKPGDLSVEQVASLACAYADCVLQLQGVLEKELKKQKADSLYDDIEFPLISVLSDMEIEGITVDRKFLEKLQEKLETEAEDLEQAIYGEAGREFTIQSPKQLGDVLFKELKLPTQKKTKTGYSTDVEVLETLSRQHALPAMVLEYREIMKLKSTYVDALISLSDHQGRVHTSFNQAGTVTGRLSSSDPNLQNIPIRTERGRQIRQAFKASKGKVLVVADYSQIELRLMAHYSQDPRMLEAFHHNEDIHAKTAGEVFGVGLDKVSKDQRRIAKAINFGLIYGQSAFGLSNQLGIPKSDAASYIDQYFKTYAKVKTCMDSLVSTARKKGYAETLFGRRRLLPDLKSKNRMKVGFAERTAINTPLQGSAADIIKMAMVSLHDTLTAKFPQTKLLLQVHDELVVECPKDKAEKVSKLVVKTMEEATKIDVPLSVGVGQGPNWGAKD